MGDVFYPVSIHNHLPPSSGHPVIAMTTQLVKNQFWGKNMQKDIQTFVKNCQICASYKMSKQLATGLQETLPFPKDHGPISQLILLQTSHHPKATPKFSQSLKDFLRPVDLSHYILPLKQQNSYFTMYSVSRASPRTFCQIEAPSSHPEFGQHSLNY